ncbi:MAG: EamA family transporter [Nanoarchaeota archaeon]
MLPGIIATFLASLEATFERFLLIGTRQNPKKVLVVQFTIVFLIMCILAPFLLEIPLMNAHYILVFAGMLIAAAFFNAFFFIGLKHVHIEKAQPLLLSNFIFTILLAIIFFPDERSPFKVFLAVVASLVLIAIHIKKHHLVFSRFELMLLGYAIMISIHNVLIKELLTIFTPFSLYFFRAGLMSILLALIFHAKLTDYKKNTRKQLLVAATVTALNITMYWSYQVSGIVVTSLLLTASPVLAIWISRIMLKERVHTKNVFATLIICICISLSLLF